MPERLRYLTSGESHGKALLCTLEGLPSSVPVSSEDINKDLRRRQGGYGRGGRMKIESDTAQILSGVRHGKTIGSPISLLIENKDWQNWQDIMSPDNPQSPIPNPQSVTRPRPGHADLAGTLKYNTHDVRDILERSSARETAARVALGAIARKFLSEFGVSIGSYVMQIGSVQIQDPRLKTPYPELFLKADLSPLRCPDEEGTQKMTALIDDAIQKGDTLGGIFKLAVLGVPPGLGSHIHWDRRLDGRLSQAIMSIQAIKGVEIGTGFRMAERFGSEVMDEIFYRAQSTEHRAQTKKVGFYRKTNNAGGIEGGISNGMPIVLRAVMKPIPTLRKPLRSVDIITKEPFEAAYERSDTCAVPAASVVAEAMTALVIAEAFLEKFGGDSMDEVKRNYEGYLEQIGRF
ncbi:MAG: chorismate synthase [Nitrospirae bacterium]|nr:chorismate synthase [Nitrospirota bacterium]